MRFAEDFETLFHDGLSTLDNGEKLNKAVRKDLDDDDEPTGCLKCHFKPFGKRCNSCVRQRDRQAEPARTRGRQDGRVHRRQDQGDRGARREPVSLKR